jgi:hypothetical protein
MSMVAVAIGGSALIGAGASIYAGNKAAGAQRSAANSAIAEQDKMYGLNSANAQPYLNAGANAVNLQNQYLAGDTSGFDNSPDYKFAVQQGTKQLDAGATANGNLWGGGADADRISLGQGLATQYANNYWNKISGVAAQGNYASGALAGVGMNTANQISGQYNNIGQSQASSYANQANQTNNLLGQFGNLAGQMSQSSYGGNNNFGTTAGGGMIGNGTGGLGMQLQTPTNSSYNFGYAPTTLGF